MLFAEEFARHTARRLSDAASRDARFSTGREELAGHIATRGDVATRTAGVSPGKEDFAGHTAQWGSERNINAAVGDSVMDLMEKNLQSLTPQPQPEKMMSTFDHRGGEKLRQHLHVPSPGWVKLTVPPKLVDPPSFTLTFPTTRMKSMLGYGGQVACQDS